MIETQTSLFNPLYITFKYLKETTSTSLSNPFHLFISSSPSPPNQINL